MDTVNFSELAQSVVIAERKRQVDEKGCDDYCDDSYVAGELARAASCYANLAGKPGSMSTAWPWKEATFKPSDDKLRDLSKAGALILAEIERVCRNGVAVLPVTVVRDEMGFWTHPAWPEQDEDDCVPKSWFADRGLQLSTVDFEGDASEELQAEWFAEGSADCSAWTPTHPDGEGWFIFSIHDTDDGPICVFVRPRRFADSEREVAERQANK